VHVPGAGRFRFNRCGCERAAGSGGVSTDGRCKEPVQRAIVARGNVPLLIEDCLLAEVPRAQLEHEWQVGSTISDADAATYCQRCRGRLSRAFDSGIAAADLPDLVANAAVLFVLSLRKAGLSSTRDISPCTVQYDGSSRTGEVCAAA
jgi:hypothetical protein